MRTRTLAWAVLGWALAVLDLLGMAPPGPLTATHEVRVFDQWDGMPYLAVSGLATTADGRLWLATFRDLACYDGIGFRRVPEREMGCLEPLQVQSLRTDRDGRLWLAGGAMLGVMEKGVWRFLGAQEGIPRATLRHLAVLGNGEAWASWEGGLLRVRANRSEAVDPPPGTGDEACPLVADEVDRLWCANRRGVWRREGEVWHAEAPPGGVERQDVCGIGPARAGGIWVAYDREAWRLHSGRWGERRERPDGMHGDAVTVLEDRFGGLWIGGWTTGLARLGQDGSAEVARAGQGFSSGSVTSLVEDVAGNVWVGLNGGWLARVRRLSFRAFGVEAGLRSVVNGMVEEEPGVMAVGTHGAGLVRWKNGEFMAHPDAGTELGEGVTVQSVLKDRAGEWWVGTAEKGLLHGRNGRWAAVSAAETGARIIRGLHEDRAGRLWVGTAAGMSVREGGRFRVCGESDGLPHMVVHGMAEDGEGQMWVCGMGYGLFRRVGQRFERVVTPGMADAHRFACLAAGRDGSMWVGVLGEGVVRVKAGAARAFGRESGLTVGDSVALAEDGEGQLWIWTSDRCQRVPVASFDALQAGKASRLDVRMFDRRDGFPGAPRVGFHPVMMRGGDGRMWWATVKGLAVVDVGGLPMRMGAPGVRWRWVRDGAGQHEGEGAGTRELWVGRPKDGLELAFRSERFDAPEHVRYEARLLPHGAWLGVFNEHRLNMKELRPGKYRWEVRASEREGLWGEPSALNFEVPQPLWQRGWFAGLLMAGTVGLAVPLARVAAERRTRRRIRQLEQETMLERERRRIAQDLHDDVGAGVTQMALLLERAIRVESMPAEAMERVQEGLRVARGTMGSLDAAVWAVNPSNDTWSELVGYLGQMVVEFCQSAGMRAVLDLPERPEERAVGAEWRHHVVLIVKEAVNNSITHSGGTEVRLRVAVATRGMELEISDDGKGLPGRKPAGEGNGLNNLASRARSMGGQLDVDGREGRGTTVSAFIPWPGGKS